MPEEKSPNYVGKEEQSDMAEKKEVTSELKTRRASEAPLVVETKEGAAKAADTKDPKETNGTKATKEGAKGPAKADASAAETHPAATEKPPIPAPGPRTSQYLVTVDNKIGTIIKIE